MHQILKTQISGSKEGSYNTGGACAREEIFTGAGGTETGTMCETTTAGCNGCCSMMAAAASWLSLMLKLNTSSSQQALLK